MACNLQQIPINTTAINLDAVIETLRGQIAGAIPQLEFVLPRAYPKKRRNENGSTLVYPAVERIKAIQGTYDDMSVEPTENNFCFFLVNGGENESDEGWLEVDLSIIFYFDLRKIQTNSPNVKAYLKQQIRSVLELPVFRRFEIYTNIEILDNSFEEVWREFNLNDLNQQYYRYPYYTVRANFGVSYQLNCPVNITYNINQC